MLKLRRRLSAMCFLALCLPSPVAGQTPDGIATTVDAAVAKQIADHRAGAAALVVVVGDRVVLARGYGDANPGAPVQPDTTLFRMASVSKVFVAAAATQLAVDGRLDLNATVATYVPDAAIQNPFHRAVTTADLLTHTSGFGSSFQHALAATPADLIPLRTFFSRYPIDVVAVPGSGFAYSNVGMALAGTVVEAVSGQSFDAYAQERMLGPLGMTRSSFAQPLPADLAADLAGSRNPRQPPLIVPYPAGSLQATVTDMGDFSSRSSMAARSTGGRSSRPRRWRSSRAITGATHGCRAWRSVSSRAGCEGSVRCFIPATAAITVCSGWCPRSGSGCTWSMPRAMPARSSCVKRSHARRSMGSTPPRTAGSRNSVRQIWSGTSACTQ